MKQSNDPQKMSQFFSVPYKDNLGEAFHIQDLATSISEQRQSIQWRETVLSDAEAVLVVVHLKTGITPSTKKQWREMQLDSSEVKTKDQKHWLTKAY